MSAVKEISKKELWGGNQSPFSISYGKMMMWFFLVSDALTFSGLLISLGFARYHETGAWPIGEEIFEAMPFLGSGYPLMYVALMTFLLIISSVTMVLAVEAGHRNDKKGVVKWMLWTLIGGVFFVSSQAWEWSHFIHGTHGGVVITETMDRAHPNHHVEADWTGAEILEHHHDFTMTFNKHKQGFEDASMNEYVVAGAEAAALWDNKINHIQGANLTENEYGPQLYANFFFFVTGFHGFHVFSGVIINLIVFLMAYKGVFEKRGHYEMIEKAGLYWHFVDLVWVFVFTFFYLV